jgi:hypothetical protein
MHSEGIISNAITEDIRLKGHLSLRFAPDGFSVLLADASYRPAFLKQFTYDSTVSPAMYPAECIRILEEHSLGGFEGETVIIEDSRAFTVLPSPYFDESMAEALLEKAVIMEQDRKVGHRYLRERDLYIVFAYRTELELLKEYAKGEVKILHTAECLVSLSDQIQASDHQRGFILAEVQAYTLFLLVVREDGIRLLNRYALKDSSDFVYHTLNTVRQMELDRENIPVYLSGIIHEEHELFGLLGKYIRQVKVTPYYLEELSRTEMLRFMILSEGSKCA